MEMTKNKKANSFLLISAVLAIVSALQKFNDIFLRVRYGGILEGTIEWINLLPFAVMVCLAAVVLLVLRDKRAPQWLGLPLSLYWMSIGVNYLIGSSYDLFLAWIAPIPVACMVVTILTAAKKIPTVVPMLVLFALVMVWHVLMMLFEIGNNAMVNQLIAVSAFWFASLAVAPEWKRKKRPFVEETPVESVTLESWRDGLRDYGLSETRETEPSQSEEDSDRK